MRQSTYQRLEDRLPYAGLTVHDAEMIALFEKLGEIDHDVAELWR